MTRLPVCHVKELPPGSRRIVESEDKISIGVFNVDGEFYALKNVCPHRMAPLCQGEITGHVTSDAPGHAEMCGPDSIIRCPWHGWEFEISTGRSVFNPHKVRVKTYPVSVDPVCGAETGDPSVESYPVEVVDGIITVLLR